MQSVSTNDPVLNTCLESRKGRICGGRLCEHFPEMCTECFEEKVEDPYSQYSYCFRAQCLYCLLKGDQMMMYRGGSRVEHGRYIYKLGHHDGYSGKTLFKMNCLHHVWVEIYMDGYKAGQTMRELEECKASFCTLLPDFLAKTDN